MESSNHFHESFRNGLIAGYVFAATFFVVIYVSYCVPWIQLSKRMKKKKAKQICKSPRQELKQRNIREKQKQARHVDKLLPLKLLEKTIEVTDVGRLTSGMSYTELCNLTDYFSVDSAIGVGMSGIMYKATLPNGWFLAVKRLYDSQLFNRQFDLEIMILGRYRHRNIVPLFGFSIEEERKERILVYQYMSNGRLSNWLNDTKRLLPWAVVIRIALGVARGLSCLHHSLHMVHLSISRECILLEKNFEPKISNFGGAKFLNHDIGTNLGFEKDTYDFGILLFELIEGKKFGQKSDSFSNIEGPFFTYTYPTKLFNDPSALYYEAQTLTRTRDTTRTRTRGHTKF